ncbi:peptidase S8 and S53, subtilisin, kexin, sedolisin [Trichodesmium erythraeum IMS101]|uniref:Peptidase S8 and S53, subtilisin, kexin, sedolisin n=1 Tax=Trichodesmium erythraeum (strain IMS101) TaxID=203124 RepID=Q112J2_TRIEI|nr:PatA/PatG family cyanobactin maturation protease [Trichodesmium erythraeum GBRTRLIN201]
MPEISSIPGIKQLWAKTKGNSEVCVAVLDGLVDLKHPCFEGANLTQLPSLVQGQATPQSEMSLHGTHVASIIFGQPNSSVSGIAPHCRGLIVPIFSDYHRRTSQLNLARAIEQAVNAGANIINISGGELTDYGEAEDWLNRAVSLCQNNNVLLVAAAGNDGCECLHVPAALPTVLAAGAMGENGQPLDYSNWGENYQTQGILALGENILGAEPGGGTRQLSGTSFATPVVSGVAALLMSLQLQREEKPDSQKVRTALLKTAVPCHAQEKRRCLVGQMNISGAIAHITGETMSESEQDNSNGIEASCGCESTPEASLPGSVGLENSLPTPADNGVVAAGVVEAGVTASQPLSSTNTSNTSNNQISAMPNNSQSNNSNGITPSQPPQDVTNIVYVIGTLGYDFGTEARRDSFKQLMPAVTIGNTQIPANPYDARQMVDYLANNLSEAKSLIWTLNMELTPIYAIEAVGSFAREVYEALQELLAGEVEAEDAERYIERVSIPGKLTGRTVKLFSGQVVPVIEPVSPRGIYGWRVNTLVGSALEAVRGEQAEADDEQMRRSLSSFLNRVYYDLRNLGQTSQDRALNFAATNAFQAAQTFSTAVAAGMELDSIAVTKSPFCRMDSDCWDVQLKFFDPENNRRAKKVFRFTIDVSDFIPVTLGEVRSWSSPY